MFFLMLSIVVHPVRWLTLCNPKIVEFTLTTLDELFAQLWLYAPEFSTIPSLANAKMHLSSCPGPIGIYPLLSQCVQYLCDIFTKGYQQVLTHACTIESDMGRLSCPHPHLVTCKSSLYPPHPRMLCPHPRLIPAGFLPIPTEPNHIPRTSLKSAGEFFCPTHVCWRVSSNLVNAVYRLQSYKGHYYRGFITSLFSITVASLWQQIRYRGKTAVFVPITAGFTAVSPWANFPCHSLMHKDIHIHKDLFNTILVNTILLQTPIVYTTDILTRKLWSL